MSRKTRSIEITCNVYISIERPLFHCIANEVPKHLLVYNKDTTPPCICAIVVYILEAFRPKNQNQSVLVRLHNIVMLQRTAAYLFTKLRKDR